MATEIDEEELRRILDEGSASGAPMQEHTDDLAALRAQLATEAQRQQAETAVEPEVAAPPPSRTPIVPKVVDLTKQSPDDLEMAYAQELDRKGRQKEAFERGTREIIAGITRTPVAGIIGQPKDAVAMLLQKRARNDAVQQRNEQNRLGGAKLNFDQQEAARKAALEATQRDEGKAKDERDFKYRQEHDAQTDATSRRNADVTAGFRGREEAAKNKERDDKESAGTFPVFDGSFSTAPGLSDTERNQARTVAGNWNLADKATAELESALQEYVAHPSPTSAAKVNSLLAGASTALNTAFGQGAMAEAEAKRMAATLGADLTSPSGIAAVFDTITGQPDAGKLLLSKIKAARAGNRSAALAKLGTYGKFMGGSTGAPSAPTRKIARNPKTGERRYLNADGSLGEVVP